MLFPKTDLPDIIFKWILAGFRYVLKAAVLLAFLWIIPKGTAQAQAVSESYGNNPTSIEWIETQTEHFKIVYPEGKNKIASELARRAESVYKEYRSRLGTSPSHKIIIYYKNDDAIVSGARAQDTGEEYRVWQGNVGMQQLMPGVYTTSDALRAEIAYAFKENIEYFPVDYYFYLFSRPSPSPWSDGLISFLAVPDVMGSDTLEVNSLADFQEEDSFDGFSSLEWKEMLKGRSQIRSFVEESTNSLSEIYSRRKLLFGFIPYFDFNPAFKVATGRSYKAFEEQWKNGTYETTKPAEKLQKGSPQNESNAIQTNKNSSPNGFETSLYTSFANIRWEAPFAIPYFIRDDFGLAGYLSLKEPLRTHEFSYYGSLSFANPVRKSYFYSEYVNNSLRPRLELSYNHLPSASGFFGDSRKVQTTDVIAVSSLWKLTGLSSESSAWFAVLTLRHLALDYFPQETLRDNNPDIFYTNTQTRQTDLRGILSWRNHKPHRNNLIHPLSGQGVRFSATVSDKIFGSDVQYARVGIDGYTILPAVGDQRIYLYGNAVMDLGEPTGRDFLGFSDNGNYQLPGPDFDGSVNPGLDRFVRGYTTTLLGDRFLFGTLEYRIPFLFDTNKRLFGFIPPARTSLTVFTDAGALGGARITANQSDTRYRYSVGTEIKRVFSIGGSFELTYELGIAQPLNQAFSPDPYFNVKTAIPF